MERKWILPELDQMMASICHQTNDEVSLKVKGLKDKILTKIDISSNDGIGLKKHQSLSNNIRGEKERCSPDT